MGFYRGPNLITEGLIIALDAGNPKSYPTTGITWYDKSGNGVDGTLTNGPTFSNANMGCIVLDGTNDTVEMGTSTFTDFSNVTPWSMTLTLKSSPIITLALNFGFLAKGSSGAGLGGFFMYFSDSSAVGDSTTAQVKMRHNGTVRQAGLIELTQALSITMTYAGSGNMECYINGNYLGNFGAMTGTTTGTTLSLGIGSTYLPGNLYNFLKYNRQLSAAEVLQNYKTIKTRVNP